MVPCMVELYTSSAVFDVLFRLHSLQEQVVEAARDTTGTKMADNKYCWQKQPSVYAGLAG